MKHINELHPHTSLVLNIMTENKPYSGTGSCKEPHHYVSHMEYKDEKGKEIVTIPYQADKLIEQAVYLIRLANHCIENNTNIQYK